MRFQGTVDEWYQGQVAWAAELAALREVARASGLRETLKWGTPTYADEADQNVLMIGAFKAGATLSFVRGALVDDPGGDLVSPGENSRSARYVLVTSVAEVEARRPAIDRLVQHAIALTRAGVRVPAPDGEPDYADELRARIEEDASYGAAFRALTPGRRRAWHILVSGAKTAPARTARVDRSVPRVLAGKGPNDCICGHSKRPPGCDGTHKDYSA